MKNITFKPKQVTKNLLVALPDRARDVVTNRFGLGKDSDRETLEAIGGKYNITRERVRQIENFALNVIKKSEAYEAEKAAFEELRDFVASLGHVVSEDDLLEHAAKDDSTKNHIHFLLVLGNHFTKKKEDPHFKHRWHVDEKISNEVHQALHSVYQDLDHEDLIPESEMLNRFADKLKNVAAELKREEVLRRWLNISKMVGRNQLGEWGLAASPNIHARGIRDYAYLIIRRHGSPLHFTEVAKAITDIFGRPAHVATCHNELIKDKERFVLVGRGLYGLAEWGYTDGVVRDVIRGILEKNGPLTRDELVSKVLKERYVKENTVIVNLQNKKFFKRNDKGAYTLVK